MTIAERWVRDTLGGSGAGPAAIETKAGWTVYLSDGKEKISHEEWPALKKEIDAEKEKSGRF